MKICTRCNTVYPDDVTVCPKDRTTLRAAEAAQKTGFQAAEHVQRAIDGEASDSGPAFKAAAARHDADDSDSLANLPAEPSPTPAPAGLVLDKPVETNGTGSVYRGSRGKKPVAVRLVKVDGRLLGRDAMIAELKKAGDAARQLNAPNIVSVMSDGERDGQFFLETEFVEGVLLRTTLAKQEPVPISEITDVARQACLAFEHAHARGVVHGNLHPGNVIAEWDGTVKLLDFGVAVFPDDAHAGPGRLRYIAPEHAGGDPADPKADLFSLGAMLYEMATGKQAFPGNEPGEVMQQLLSVMPPPPHEVNAKIHPGLSKVILKALSKSPEERYQSATEMLKDLENYRSLADPEAVGKAAAAGAATGRTAAMGTNTGKITSPAAERPRIAAKTPTPLPPLPRPAVVMKAKKSSVNLIVGIVAAVLIAIGVAVGYFMLHRPAPATANSAPAASEGAAPGAATSGAAGQPTAHATMTHRAPTKKPEAGTSPSAPAAITTGEVSLATTPSGAAIEIDGQKIAASTPATVSGIAAGEHAVKLTVPGFVPETRSFSVAAGKTFYLAVPLKPQGAMLEIGSDPAGAAISIDGAATGKVTPAQIASQPGKHAITLHKDGYLDAGTTATLTAGQPFRYSPSLLVTGSTSDIRAKGLFGGRPATMGGLKIETRPKGATITINGKPVGKKSPVELNLNPGNYQVTLEMPGYKPMTSIVNIVQGNTAHLDETMQKQ